MRGLLGNTGGLHQALSSQSWVSCVAARSRREAAFHTQVQQDQCHAHFEKCPSSSRGQMCNLQDKT